MSIFVHRIPIDCIKLSNGFACLSLLLRVYACLGFSVLFHFRAVFCDRFSIFFASLLRSWLFSLWPRPATTQALLISLQIQMHFNERRNQRKKCAISNYKWIDKVVKGDQVSARSHATPSNALELAKDINRYHLMCVASYQLMRMYLQIYVIDERVETNKWWNVALTHKVFDRTYSRCSRECSDRLIHCSTTSVFFLVFRPRSLALTLARCKFTRKFMFSQNNCRIFPPW